MKIAVVVPKYGLVGGAERVVFELTERLAVQENVDIHVFANAWRPGFSPVTFHRLPRFVFPRSLRPLVFAFTAARMTARGRFDLIHSHERILDMDVFTMHGIPHRTWIREARGKRMSLFDLAVDWVERRGITRAAPFILPVSSLVKDELCRIYPLNESKLKVIHPGIDQTFFNIPERGRLRATWGFTEEDVVFLFVGMNFEIKRLDLAMESLAAAVHAGAGVRPALLVAGRGDLKRYKARAEALGVSERVKFAGVVEDMVSCYASADVFFMPSRFDTFGLVVLEAMAAGLPVIITDRTGAKDLVTSGREGFVVPVDAPASEFAACIGRLMNSERREHMGNYGRTAAAANSWDAVASRVMEVYRSVPGRGAR